MDEEATPSAADEVSASLDTAVLQPPVEKLSLEGAATTEPSLRTLEEQICALTAQISEQTSLARHREQTISRLHDEIQELRKGELAQALAPVIRDLIRFHDDFAAFVVEQDEKQRDPELLKSLAYFRDEALRMLDRNDVEAFDPLPGERFDPTQHRASRSVPTDDPALDRTIASVQRRGFRRGARVVRAAEVTVHRSDAGPRSAPSTAGESSVKGDPS